MMNLSILAIMMLTMVIGGITNINAITPNTTITTEDDGSIDKSKFDWGPINCPETGTIPSPKYVKNNNNDVQSKIASPFYKEKKLKRIKNLKKRLVRTRMVNGQKTVNASSRMIIN